MAGIFGNTITQTKPPRGDRTWSADTPPAEGYRVVGWHCIYHEARGRDCHNPLDCDWVPVWAMTWEAAHAQIRLEEEDR